MLLPFFQHKNREILTTVDIHSNLILNIDDGAKVRYSSYETCKTVKKKFRAVSLIKKTLNIIKF